MWNPTHSHLSFRLPVPGQQLRLSFEEARPIVQLIFAARFAVGGAFLLATTHDLNLLLALTGQIAWLFAAWAVYLYNGLTDRIEDQANGSSRPIATGKLEATTATYICAALATGGLLIGSLVSLQFAALIVGMLALGALYSAGHTPLKSFPVLGLATAGGGVFLTYVAGGYAYTGHLEPSLLLIATVMALWTVAAGNTKDFGDIEGDREAGRKSLPILLGIPRAAAFTSTASCAVAALALLVGILVPLAIPLWMLIPGSVVIAVRLRSIDPDQSRQLLRRGYRSFMQSQYAANIGLLIVCLIGGLVYGVHLKLC